MGIMDREWYRERFARRVIGIEGPLDDPTGEPARIRRGVASRRPQLPPGVGPGMFWWRLYWVICAVAGVVMILAKLRG